MLRIFFLTLSNFSFPVKQYIQIYTQQTTNPGHYLLSSKSIVLTFLFLCIQISITSRFWNTRCDFLPYPELLLQVTISYTIFHIPRSIFDVMIPPFSNRRSSDSLQTREGYLLWTVYRFWRNPSSPCLGICTVSYGISRIKIRGRDNLQSTNNVHFLKFYF